ncbi:3-ketoacyl-CoA thiolase B, peroxisomal, partial [Zancudomyces culisetae]
MASNRLDQITSHFAGAGSQSVQIGVKNPEDVVIVSALRTPITRGRRGGFKDTTHEYLLSVVLKGIVEKSGIDPALIDDVVVGNVLPPGGGAAQARMAMLHAGYPEASGVMALNRQCASGLQAVAQVAAAIRDGTIEIGVAAGAESMTASFGDNKRAENYYDQEMLKTPAVRDCLLPMGITSENVATQFGVSRQKQDQFALRSHQKASYAQKNGLFKEEILPVKTKVKDAKGNVLEVIVSEDDGIRHDATLQSLGSLKPAFKPDGASTAGNSSQVSDGAAAVLLMKRKKATELGLPIIGKFITSAVVGVPPSIMGVGPAYAIPEAVKKAGITINDLDVVELNEAFASQA